MKQEWKKCEKSLYLPGEVPQLMDIPAFKYIMIEGEGDPNGPDYEARVSALYSLSYAVKMSPKKGYTPEGYIDYAVYPLEGVYALRGGTDAGVLDKDKLVYTIMIRQPDFVTGDVFAWALEAAAKKKDASPKLGDAHFDAWADGLSLQVLHTGSYDDEPATFAVMDRFLEEQGLTRRDDRHREIYHNDPRRTSPDKLKTVLRYFIARQ